MSVLSYLWANLNIHWHADSCFHRDGVPLSKGIIIILTGKITEGKNICWIRWTWIGNLSTLCLRGATREKPRTLPRGPPVTGVLLLSFHRLPSFLSHFKQTSSSFHHHPPLGKSSISICAVDLVFLQMYSEQVLLCQALC